jgi:predicted enzyme related to lactoylglutathione lyase
MRSPVVRFEVVGQDPDKLRSFYGELLGWSFQGIGAMNYGVVAAGEGGIPGGIGEARGAQGWLTFYTEVPDLQAALAKAVRMGSRVLLPMRRRGDTTIAVISDPEGNPVGLCAAR